MMTNEGFSWEAPQVTAEDQRLIEAYLDTGVALDALAYTDDFQSLARKFGVAEPSDEDLRVLYRRLLALRKKGVLPRLYGAPPSDREDTHRKGA
jgi:hypothetical protein